MKIPMPVKDEPEAKARLKEAMLYVAGICAGDNKFGAVKLSKILCFADMLSYAKHGKAITGAKYKSMQNGPVPISLHDLKDEMVASQEIVVRKIPVMDYQQHCYVPLRDANLESFSGRDIAIINQVIDYLRDKTATEVSELSHTIAWRVYQNAEYIPMESFFLSGEGVTDKDIARAQELIQEHGWDDA